MNRRFSALIVTALLGFGVQQVRAGDGDQTTIVNVGKNRT